MLRALWFMEAPGNTGFMFNVSRREKNLFSTPGFNWQYLIELWVKDGGKKFSWTNNGRQEQLEMREYRKTAQKQAEKKIMGRIHLNGASGSSDQLNHQPVCSRDRWRTRSWSVHVSRSVPVSKKAPIQTSSWPWLTSEKGLNDEKQTPQSNSSAENPILGSPLTCCTWIIYWRAREKNKHWYLKTKTWFHSNRCILSCLQRIWVNTEIWKATVTI